MQAADHFDGQDTGISGHTGRHVGDELLHFLGYPRAGPPVRLPQMARLLRFGARLDHVFPLLIDEAPAVRFAGAMRTISSTAGFGGDGSFKANYAGLGVTGADALARCLGEAAEHDAMMVRRSDPRVGADGCLNFSGSDTGDMHRIPASAVLRQVRGDSSSRPRSSTGFAAGSTFAEARSAAVCECVERHAIALWFDGSAAPLATAMAAPAIDLLRLAQARFMASVRLFELRHAFTGYKVMLATALNRHGDMACGYGCAPGIEVAQVKAVSELIQAFLALQLERRRGAEDTHPPPGSFLAKSSLFKTRRPLFEAEAPGDGGGTVAMPRVLAADLTVAEVGIPVCYAIVNGLRDCSGETATGQTGPL